MVSQVTDILMGHVNLKNYIDSHLDKIENIYMIELLDQYLKDTQIYVEKLRVYLQEEQTDEYESGKINTGKNKNWKKDLSYARTIQIMWGYILNFYTPVENLSKKLRNTEITHVIAKLHESTQKSHDDLSQISMQLINNKFLN